MGPGEPASDNALHDQMVSGMCRSYSDSKVKLPFWSEIDVDRREELLLLISERGEVG